MVEKEAKIGKNVKFWHPELSNIGICEIGDNTVIHAGVHIHDGVKIGKNCQIEANVFIPTGVTIEDNVFVGPGTIFTNDPRLLDIPRSEWKPTPTLVKAGAKIGAGARILAGVTIGKKALIGMGAVLLKSVGDWEIWVGHPAKFTLKHTFDRNEESESVMAQFKPEPEQDFSHLNGDHFLN